MSRLLRAGVLTLVTLSSAIEAKGRKLLWVIPVFVYSYWMLLKKDVKGNKSK